MTELTASSDNRLAFQAQTGLNGYFCSPTPDRTTVVASSCTASPIEKRGFELARSIYDDVKCNAPRGREGLRVTEEASRARSYLLKYHGIDGISTIALHSSGTDAVRAAALLLWCERPKGLVNAVLPSASETGSAVPLAARCRGFDGYLAGTPLCQQEVNITEVALRHSDGSPRSADEIAEAFRVATRLRGGRAIIYLTHSTKTGLISPAFPPDHDDVIVDACQARISPAAVAGYLRRGWPVAVSGSKFYGGPAFSGAVLFPTARLTAATRSMIDATEPPTLGTVLRWTAALSVMEAFQPVAHEMPAFLRRETATIYRKMADNPALVPVQGLAERGPDWADMPSIFTFAVRDPVERDRLLTIAELRPLYERLALSGVLLGQPVNLGSFGGLRIAVGARDLLGEGGPDKWDRIFAGLASITAPECSRSPAAVQVA